VIAVPICKREKSSPLKIGPMSEKEKSVVMAWIYGGRDEPSAPTLVISSIDSHSSKNVDTQEPQSIREYHEKKPERVEKIRREILLCAPREPSIIRTGVSQLSFTAIWRNGGWQTEKIRAVLGCLNGYCSGHTVIGEYLVLVGGMWPAWPFKEALGGELTDIRRYALLWEMPSKFIEALGYPIIARQKRSCEREPALKPPGRKGKIKAWNSRL